MEFSLEPNNCLRSSLRQILKNGHFSDVQISLNGNKVYKLHKSILSARSEKFSFFFDYFENKNDSDTFFSEKLKPILKKTTSVFEEKKCSTDFGKENNESIFQDRKPKSLKTIAWRLEPQKAEVNPSSDQQELEIELDSDSDDLEGLDFQLDESKASLLHKPDTQKKPIENQNGFLKFKLWKPSVEGTQQVATGDAYNLELFSSYETRTGNAPNVPDASSEREQIEKLFDHLVEFIYTGDIKVEQDSAEQMLYLLILAESFQVLDLKKR